MQINKKSLTSHCFVTGSTGSGKSNTVYCLLKKLIAEEKIPFLIIEPAKGEYRNEFRKVPEINLFTTNPWMDQLLKLNPFSFCKEIHILEHLDRLIEIFNTCWEMYAAMPAILKEAVEQAYVSKGWDLINSVYIGGGEPTFPTFVDVLKKLPEIINRSEYSSDTKGDYIGALVTRVNSMTNGIYGQIFCDEFEIDEKTLFDENSIVDLSRVGSSETKSLIMGVLVLKLTEYRMAHAQKGNIELRHITVLEEAHNLLKNVDNVKGTAGNSIVSKSVEMIVNSIAEMRTYGEGFVIVDQSPTAVDIAAIKNTNTKIVMRLPEKEDCRLAGYALSLKDSQIEELPKLETGVAVVMQNDWNQAVLGKIDCVSHKYEGYEEKVSFEKMKVFKSAVIEEILSQFVEDDAGKVEKIYEVIDRYEITSGKKKEMRRIAGALCRRMSQEFNSILLGRTLLRMTGCNEMLELAEEELVIDNEVIASFAPSFDGKKCKLQAKKEHSGRGNLRCVDQKQHVSAVCNVEVRRLKAASSLAGAATAFLIMGALCMPLLTPVSTILSIIGLMKSEVEKDQKTFKVCLIISALQIIGWLILFVIASLES